MSTAILVVAVVCDAVVIGACLLSMQDFPHHAGVAWRRWKSNRKGKR